MDWSALDWHTLERLRDGFIKGSAASGPYWRTTADLANYDFTYAERIGWKWDAVLSELQRRTWTPPKNARTLIDWGCGSGIAGRRMLRAFGAEKWDALLLWDHSPLARDFAAAAARKEFPQLRIETPRETPDGFTLIISHVINELDPRALENLIALARQAEAIIWVEPGTHADSHALVNVREKLREAFAIVAPCPHAEMCGLLAPEAERHWCHNFAEPPAGIYADSNWVKFGQRAGVDLRSLPYSFLVLQKRNADGSALPNAQNEPANPVPALSRIIGRARFHKAHATICNCDRDGVSDLTFYKRSDPAFFKQLERRPAHPPLYEWRHDPAHADRIVGGKSAIP